MVLIFSRKKCDDAYINMVEQNQIIPFRLWYLTLPGGIHKQNDGKPESGILFFFLTQGVLWLIPNIIVMDLSKVWVLSLCKLLIYRAIKYQSMLVKYRKYAFPIFFGGAHFWYLAVFSPPHPIMLWMSRLVCDCEVKTGEALSAKKFSRTNPLLMALKADKWLQTITRAQ